MIEGQTLKESASARCDEIERKINEAPGWGSWMAGMAAEHDSLVRLHGLKRPVLVRRVSDSKQPKGIERMRLMGNARELQRLMIQKLSSLDVSNDDDRLLLFSCAAHLAMHVAGDE